MWRTAAHSTCCCSAYPLPPALPGWPPPGVREGAFQQVYPMLPGILRLSKPAGQQISGSLLNELAYRRGRRSNNAPYLLLTRCACLARQRLPIDTPAQQQSWACSGQHLCAVLSPTQWHACSTQRGGPWGLGSALLGAVWDLAGCDAGSFASDIGQPEADWKQQVGENG